MIDAADLPTTLQPNHPLLQDGYNDGFRAPDLGWVGAQNTDAELEAELFETSSLLFANFWVGPMETAKDFAAALVLDFQGWLTDVQPEQPGDENAPVVTVAYWEDPASGLALVATQSITPDFMIGDLPESFEAFDRFGAVMTQVAFDGNDNSPYDAVSGIVDLQGAERDARCKLIVASVCADIQEEVSDFYKQECAQQDSRPANKM